MTDGPVGMTGVLRTALAAAAGLALAQVPPPAEAAGPPDRTRCVAEVARGLIELRALLTDGRPVNLEMHKSDRMRTLEQALDGCGLTIKVIYRPVACAARHGRVLELNPYFREGVYVRRSQVVLVYVGVYPFAALPDFRTGTLGDALRDWDVRDGDQQCPGKGWETTGDRIRLDVSVGQARSAPEACTIAPEATQCTHVLPATVSCAKSGGAMPDDASQRLALKVEAQVPAAGTPVGLNHLRDGTGRIPALSDFPSFPTGQTQVHLLVDCPVPTRPISPLDPIPLVSSLDPITIVVLGGAAGVGGAVAARAIARRREEDPPSAVGAGQASEPLPPGRVLVRGRPDIP